MLYDIFVLLHMFQVHLFGNTFTMSFPHHSLSTLLSLTEFVKWCCIVFGLHMFKINNQNSNEYDFIKKKSIPRIIKKCFYL